MLRKGGFIFTNRNHPVKGIMSFILGMISWITILTAIHFTYQNGGISDLRCATAGLLAFLFGASGFILGIMSRMEKDKYYLFSYLGIGLNGSFLCLTGFILYAGVYGI